jgi:hypothetical protein
MRRRLVWTAALAASLGCGDAEVVPATEVLIVVHSDLGADIASIDAHVFDEREQRASDNYTFDPSAWASDAASGQIAPFSFALVPSAAAPSARVLVVLTGRNSAGTVIAQNKVITSFLEQKIVAVDLWLLAGCRNVVCAAGQTCGAPSSVSGQCSPTPEAVPRAVEPHQEVVINAVGPVLQPAFNGPAADAGVGDGGDASPLGGMGGPGPDAGDASQLGGGMGGLVPDAGMPADAGRADASTSTDASVSGPDAGRTDAGPSNPEAGPSDAAVDADADIDAFLGNPDASGDSGPRDACASGCLGGIGGLGGTGGSFGGGAGGNS